MKKGYFFKLKQYYFKELKVIHENEIINTYPLITVGAYEEFFGTKEEQNKMEERGIENPNYWTNWGLTEL
mgnify:CR=1 FL=1